MINFRVTDIQGGLLTIERPAGQEISLKLAEIVKAQVMEILPSGALKLKLKGEQLTAKSQVPLQQGQSAFFKVTELPVEGKDLKLQFIGLSQDEQIENQNNLSPITSDGKRPFLMPLLKELQGLIEQVKSLKAEQNVPISKNIRLQELNSEILKSLPTDIQRLSKDTRVQLQELLQNSLKLTGQNIQSRLSEILKDINPEMLQSKSFNNIKKELSLNIEQILNSSLKGAIQDSGVALEAKLKHLAQTGPLPNFDDIKKTFNTILNSNNELINSPSMLKGAKEEPKGLTLQRPEDNKAIQKGQNLSNEVPQLSHDLKAKLLQLKQDMQDYKSKLEEFLPQLKNNKSEIAQINAKISSIDTSLHKIDNLLKDIETFQALSKATNSFYTFLPIEWDNLKNGDISFKKGKRGNLQSFSCTINLDLNENGKLGIIVMQYGKDFFVSMRVKNKDFQDKIASNIILLEEAFKSKGMNLKSAKVFDFDNKEAFEEIEELTLENGGLSISI